ncbi:MAG: sensor histidine kinase [Vicinamibacterales bacterium]
MIAPRSPSARALSRWLIAGIGAAVAVLVWFGYSTSLEWRHSSEQLLTRRTEEMADLLVRALARDMRGVHDQVLRTVQRDQIALDHPEEFIDIVSTAFARYPYPECFFVWSAATAADGATFFARSDRLPTWLPRPGGDSPYPVTTARRAEASHTLVSRATAAAAQGREFAVFETAIDGVRYQVVTRFIYGTPRRVRLEQIVGFVVNLPWARAAYFPELTSEVQHISGTYDGLDVAVQDDAGALVAGALIPTGAAPTTSRTIRPLFFDPSLVAVDPPDDLSPGEWTVKVSAAGDPAHASAVVGADRTLALTTLAAIAFGFGLLLTGRALRDRATLAELRADFVASVTHELKTPLATITAVGETLAGGRVSEGPAVREYAQIIGQESKRLTRLVDNLLAYSRVTDVGEIYAVEPLAVADVVDDIARRFHPQFVHQGVDLTIDIPADLLPIAADRTALDLVLDNVIDNALRYSTDDRRIAIRARQAGTMVDLTVSDHGMGIAPEELHKVERRFVRGRRVGRPGSGLGLAIASRIVRDLSGEFTLESTLGQGTTVHLRLPVSEIGQ